MQNLTPRSGRKTILIVVSIMLVAFIMLTTVIQFSNAIKFLDPQKDAVTDIKEYQSVLFQWQPTGLVTYFPATISPSAKNVSFSAFPEGLQGSAWIQLRCELPPADVAKIEAAAKALAGKVYPGGGGEFDHLNKDPKNEWPTAAFYTGDFNVYLYRFPTTYTFYVIKAVDRGMGTWDPYDGCGIAVSSATNEVVYWATH